MILNLILKLDRARNLNSSSTCVCFPNRAEQRGAAGLQQRQQSEQQCQPAQRAEPPAPHGEEGCQLGRLLREAAAGPGRSSLLLGTKHWHVTGNGLHVHVKY